MSEIKKGAPSAGLYIKCTLSEFTALFPKLRQMFFVINRNEYEKNMHVVEIDGGKKPDQERLLNFVKLVQQNGLVALVREDYIAALAVEADGVMLERLSDIKPAREALGEDAIIGMACGDDQKKMEEALELGIDFVGFSSINGIEMSMRWTTKTEKPCMVEGCIDSESCGVFIQAGATFIEASQYIFNHPKESMQATVNMLDAIEHAGVLKTLN